MTTTIGIIQVKGGAGRSTLATNLAGELSKKGKTVLIDGDIPQGTSASWFALRRDAGRAGNLTADTARDHRELIEKVAKHVKAADYIVLDGPPRIAEKPSTTLRSPAKTSPWPTAWWKRCWAGRSMSYHRRHAGCYC